MQATNTARAVGLSILFLAAAFVATPGRGDHPIPIYEGSTDSTVTFDHRAGNEWWVEVNVTATGGNEVGGVKARPESGTWEWLELQPWGNWAASIHVPVGERVQVQAFRAGGMSDVWRRTSCFYTHPAGVEQCDPGATDNLKVTFRAVPGNAWWQETYIDSNRPIGWASVHKYTVDGWETKALAERSWGAWATSMHAPRGSVVVFTASDGAEGRESPCHYWPTAEHVACPPDYGPNGPSAFMTRFDHKTGNEWWVEALVGPVQATRVQARDTNGAWTEMTLRSWGAWAASFRIEPGHKVQFQALVDGEWFLGCWYAHPNGISEAGYQVCEHL